ncbi:MAG: hypothetical protein Q4A24_05970 [Akkermansia sp.]|nr:hypothetical protein [Akkermansia sp.]
MIIQPVLPWPLLVPLLVALPAVVGWLCVAAGRQLSRGLQWCCVLLSVLTTLCGCLLLLNPGYVEQRPSANAPVWLVGVDTSASMAAPAEDDPTAPSRAQLAAQALQRFSSVRDREIIWLSLAESARAVDSASLLSQETPGGAASHVMAGLAAQAESVRRRGRTLAGVVMVTDGRETNAKSWQALVSRAGASGCPVHVLPLGKTWQAPDLAVHTLHPFVHAYPGVETRIVSTISNTRMGDLQLQVELADAQGNKLSSQTLQLSAGEQKDVSFPLLASEGEYVVRVVPQPGESRTDNNATRITVRAVNARIRVFMAEGAPYWDSKFLAQYLRKQEVFDVRSVHRLSEKRFYHINSGDDDSAPSESPNMPTTLEGFSGFDIIVLGKGMEHFFNAESLAALQSYVREQGGILVLARGRCYAGKSEQFAELEPFVWASSGAAECRLLPSRAGTEQGLFGLLLPAAEARVWQELPPLEDVWPVAEVRPRTVVLAQSEQLPVLGIMRYGMGAVACINGEGLWKWDFYPEAKQHGNMYHEFWRRFLPWVQTAAEFMPGFDLSLHLERSSVQEGESASCRLSWRGLGRPNALSVQVLSLKDGKMQGEYRAVLRNGGVLPQWECSLGVLPAGEYLLRAVVPGTDTLAPECRLSVKSLPSESDNLNADPEAAVRVAEATGGLVLSAEISDDELARIFALPQGVSATEDVYCPLWNKWQVLAFMVLCLGTMWFIRRRKGLP